MFYTYIHKKPSGTIFYVGKGSLRRIKARDNRNKHWVNVVNKYGFEAEIVGTYETNQQAIEHEMKLIQELKDSGIKLVNITAGGEGVLGHRHDEISKLKMSQFQKVFQNTDRMKQVRLKNAENYRNDASKRQSHSEKIKHYMKDPANRERSRLGALKLAADPVFREKQRRRALERQKLPQYRYLLAKACVCVETGVVYKSLREATDWLKNLGYEKACHSKISMCLAGERRSAYGYHWKVA
jgi:hypothetical protein